MNNFPDRLLEVTNGSSEILALYNNVLNIDETNIEAVVQKLDYIIKRTHNVISINEHFKNSFNKFGMASIFFGVCVLFILTSIITLSFSKRYVVLNSYTKNFVKARNKKLYLFNIIIFTGFVISFASSASVVFLFG